MVEYPYQRGTDLRSLLEKIRSEDTSEDVLAFYFACLVLAMDSVHEAGFANRDFKPDNILITAKGKLVQTDFEFSVHRFLKLDDFLLILVAHLAPKFDFDFGELRTCCVELKIPILANEIESTCLRLRLDSDFSLIHSEISNLCKTQSPILTPEATLAFHSKFIKSESKKKVSKSTFFKIAPKVGSKQYYSPEIILQNRVSLASDFWALGCSIYDLHDDECLFKSDQVPLIPSFQVQNYENNCFSADAMEIFRQLLHEDPQKRVPSFNLKDLFNCSWLNRFSGIDLENVEMPFIPSSVLFDFNVSGSFLVDHVSFEFNEKFCLKSILVGQTSPAKNPQNPPREIHNEGICRSKKLSVSTHNKCPRITTETIRNTGLSNRKTRSVIRNKHLFSRESNAFPTSSQLQPEETIRRLSHSMKTSKFAHSTRILAQGTPQIFSENQKNLPKANTERPNLGLLMDLITPILEKKTSSNEEKEKSGIENTIRGEENPEENNRNQEENRGEPDLVEEEKPRVRKLEIERNSLKKQMLGSRFQRKKRRFFLDEEEKEEERKRETRAKVRKFKEMHENEKKKWRNMMKKGMSEIEIPKTKPRMEYTSHFSNQSLNKTMINFSRKGSEKQNSILRNSMHLFNKEIETKKRKLFNSIFCEWERETL